MLRQRLRTRATPLRLVGRLLVVLLAAALVWYGLMVVLLALKVSARAVNDLSGYRTVFDFLSRQHPRHVAGGTREITAAVGLLACVIFGYLARRELPRPYLARRDLELSADERGTVTVEPRAIERVAEVVAVRDPAIASARGIYTIDDIGVDVTVTRPRDLAATLRGVQQRVTEAIGEHDLPALPVNVTLAHFEQKQRRELN
ncbi:MAG: hypothetical protein NVSMB25_17270 [Thermoleophilaceae bacterium]